jgi:hypothetical protein
MIAPAVSINAANVARVGVFAGVVAANAGLLVAAAADLAGIYLVLLVIAVLLDLYLENRDQWLRTVFKTAQLSLSARGVLSSLSLGLLMVRHFTTWGNGHALAVVLLAVTLPLSRSMYLGLLGVFRIRSTRPLATRNIDLGQLADPPPPPHWLIRRVDRRLVPLGAIPLLIGAVGVVADTSVPFVVAALGYVLILFGATGYLGTQLLRWLSLPDNAAWERRSLRHIRDLQTQVVFYFSGPEDSAYQVDMWLETLEKQPYRTIVLLRERSVFDSLAPTTLPVVYMPSGVSVMQAGLSSARVALYAANTSKNLHLLREPGLKHVFIGHGDSDKVSSINPFTRVYDQVWVAGRAGRDRWARARVGVRDETVVEVGRPQLDAVKHADPSAPADRMTVLYAPTWEGWNDDTFFSSITSMGPRMIRMLLDLAPAVRVIYKPHPFTGIRDPRAARSHEQIVHLLSEANGEPSAPPQDPQLSALTAELGRSGLSVAESRERTATWASRYWTVVGASRHVVVEGAGPTLNDCFDHADVLIADVSSVVSDFLASGKPYICANPQGTNEADFLRENPTAGAAYLLGPDCLELAEIIELVRGPDPNEADRATLREYLLGPENPPSIERWMNAVKALVVESKDDRAAGPVAIDESVLEEVTDPEHATSSDSPTL